MTDTSRSDRPPPGTGEPPRLARAFLSVTLPAGVVGRTILGDLRQEYDERCAERGGSCRLWYWAQALGLGGRYLWADITSRRVRSHAGGRGRGSRTGSVSKPREEYMATLMSDLRYGLRMLVRTPMLSLIAVLTIALGVGLTTHTFSTVYGSVGRGLAVEGADRLVVVNETIPARNIQQTDVPIHDFLDFRAQATSFEFLAGFYQGTVNLAGEEGPPERYQGGFMSDNALSDLGVPPMLGRTFRDGEDLPGASPVMVLGYDVWRNRFGGDPDIVGKTVRTNGVATEIVGVMPDGFRFPFDEDLWVPHRQDPDATARRDGMYFSVFGRLAEGETLESATAEVGAIARRIEEVYPEANEGVGAYVIPYEDRFMPPQITAVMYLMFAATLGVLLIACANVANLLLARATVRGREVAIRTAMGASRGRVVRQLLAESLILGLVGGAVGLVMAWVGVIVFNAAIIDIQKPYWIDVQLDGPALLCTIVATLIAAVVAGTLPAIRASGTGIAPLLRDESRGSSSLRLGKFSTALVVTELAVSCGLLIAAGMMVKSVVNLKTLDLGFETEDVLTARVGLNESDYATEEERDQFFREVARRLQAEPGIESVALATVIPGMGAGGWRIAVEGETYETRADQPRTNGVFVGGDFFETYGVEIRSGRDFRWDEAFSGSDPVAVVNESFARKILPGQDPLGRRIRLGPPDGENPWWTVIGVVPDLHVGGGVGGLGSDQTPPETMYANTGSFDLRFLSLILKTQGNPTSFAPTARGVVSSMDPNLPLYNVMTQEEAIAQGTWAFSLFGSLFSVFGGVALFLASVGLYGVMAFSVARRRQEMGVRMALGADARDILRLVLRRGAGQLALGLVLGLAIGVGMGIPLRAVTFGVETGDPSVFAAIILTLGLTGLIATLVPALRATRVDPNMALRPD